jgi:hypothetical protein
MQASTNEPVSFPTNIQKNHLGCQDSPTIHFWNKIAGKLLITGFSSATAKPASPARDHPDGVGGPRRGGNPSDFLQDFFTYVFFTKLSRIL